jgi:Trk K+ transport system NAD-binding subunit
MLVTRGEEHLVPTGGTILQAGDALSILAAPEVLEKLRTVMKEDSE